MRRGPKVGATQGWYAIQHTPTGDWLCTLRSMSSWGKERIAFQFSSSKSDALWYRRSGAAARYLRMLIAQKGPHYHIVKEDSASPLAVKKRLKKAAADANSNKPPEDSEA